MERWVDRSDSKLSQRESPTLDDHGVKAALLLPGRERSSFLLPEAPSPRPSAPAKMAETGGNLGS